MGGSPPPGLLGRWASAHTAEHEPYGSDHDVVLPAVLVESAAGGQSDLAVTMTPRERIVVLLECYRDVLPGLVDTEGGDGDGRALLAAGPWKHPSYQRLERLLGELRHAEPRMARHLLRRFLDFTEVRRSYCRKCGLHPPSSNGKIHAHPPGKSVTLEPVVVRVPPGDVLPEIVERGIDWLHERWGGEVDLPTEIVSSGRVARVGTHATLPGRVVSRLPEIRR